MATFFLDYEGGNDASDGTTFANRWKTITGGATAARIAPGDTVKVMGSPAPTSLGINATWTNKSRTITLASALNVLIDDCETAWTASANVTATKNTNTSTFSGTCYRTGTGNAKLAVAAGFTTGKVAFFDLGSNKDYSAYQGVTFWLQVETSTLAAGVLTLDLCSDASGATPVDTLAIPAVSQVGQWIPVYIDKGSALGSAIRSISVNAITDPGTINIHLDNISTVKAAGNDALNLTSLIGKNTTDELWWAILSISGTTILIDNAPAGTPSVTSRGYWGTTETVATYQRSTVKTNLVAASTTVVQAVQDSGTAGSLITFSGGWDRTNMTTQNLQTFFDGQSGFGYGIDCNSKAYIALNNLYFVRYDRGITISGDNHVHGSIFSGHNNSLGVSLASPAGLTATEITTWANTGGGINNTNGSDWNITKMRCVTFSTTFTVAWPVNSGPAVGNWVIGTLDIHNSAHNGLAASGTGTLPSLVKITTLNTHDNGSSGFAPGTRMSAWEIDTLNANNNTSDGVYLSGASGSLRIGVLNASGNGQYGFDLSSIVPDCDFVVGNLVTSTNTLGAIAYTLLFGAVSILKSSLSEITKLTGTAGGTTRGRLSFKNFNGTAGDHRTYYGASESSGAGHGTIFAETTTRHTASGLAWKMSPRSTTYITANSPMIMSLGKVLCAASTLVTIKVWLRRTNTGLTGTLRCRGRQIQGVASDVTTSISAGADTWQEQTITFTPTEVGVVEIEVLTYGGTTYSLYVDDLTVTQA